MKPFGLLEEGFQTAAFALLSCWGWFAPFDAPKVLTCDHGVHSRGRPITRSTTSAWGAVALHWPPYQLGRGERQCGVLKTLLKV